MKLLRSIALLALASGLASALTVPYPDANVETLAKREAEADPSPPHKTAPFKREAEADPSPPHKTAPFKR